MFGALLRRRVIHSALSTLAGCEEALTTSSSFATTGSRLHLAPQKFGAFGGTLSLGAEGVLPGRYIESLLRVFNQFTHTLPSGVNGEQILNVLTTLILMGSVGKF